MVGGQFQHAQRRFESGVLKDLRMLLAVADEIVQGDAGDNPLEALRGIGIVMMMHADHELRGQFPAFQQRRAHFGMGAVKDHGLALRRGGIRRVAEQTNCRLRRNAVPNVRRRGGSFGVGPSQQPLPLLRRAESGMRKRPPGVGD